MSALPTSEPITPGRVVRLSVTGFYLLAGLAWLLVKSGFTAPAGTRTLPLGLHTLSEWALFGAGVVLLAWLNWREWRPSARVSAAAGLYRKAFETGHPAQMIVDPRDGAILDANPAACSLYGHSRDWLSAHRLSDLDAASGPLALAALSRLPEGRHDALIWRHRLASGKVSDVEVCAVPLHQAGRRYLHLTVYEADARHRAQRVLRRTLRQVNTLHQVARAMITARDAASLLRVVAGLLQADPPPDAYLFYIEEDESGCPEWMALAAAVPAGPGEYPPPGTRLRITDSALGQRYAADPPDIITVPDCLAEGALDDQPLRDLMVTLGVRAVTVVPLILAEQRVVGTVAFTWGQPRGLTAAERQLLTLLAPQLAALVEYHRLLAQADEQARFRQSLLRSLPVGLAAVDTSMHIIEVNPAWEHMFGLSRDEWIGRLAWQPFGAEDHPHTRQQISAILNGEMVAPYETFYQRKNGDVFPVRVHVTPLKDSSDEIIGVLGAVEDLTQRKAAEQALRESEERFRRVFDDGPLGMVLVSFGGEIARVNDMLCHMLGYKAHELAGKPFSNLVHPDDLAVMRRSTEHLLEGRVAAAHAEQRLVQRDGSVIWTEATTTLLVDESGQPLSILMMTQDITERRRAEAAEREQRALAEALRDTASAISGTLDLDGVFDRILANVGRVVPHDAACIMIIDGEDAVITRSRATGDAFKVSYSARRLSVARTFNLAHMVKTRQATFIADTRQEPRWSPHPEMAWIRSNVGAPIVVDDEVIGFLYLHSAWPGAFSRADAERLQAFADQTAMAIRNARLYTAEREQRALAEALAKSAAAVNSTLNLNEVLDHILESVSQVFAPDAANIMLVSGESAHVVRWRGYDRWGSAEWVESHRFDLAHYPNLHRMHSARQALCIHDTHNDPEWIHFPVTDWIRAHVAAPISVGDEVIGFLNMDSSVPGVFSPSDAGRLLAFANQAAIAIRNARLYESGRRQLRLAQTLREVGALLTAEMSLDDVLERIITLLAQVVAHDSVSVQLMDERGNLTLIVGHGFPDVQKAKQIASRVLTDTLQERWADRDVIVISDTLNDSRWVVESPQDYIRSWIGAALRVKGRLIGVLNVDSAIPGAYDDDMAATVLAFANQAAIAIENARLYAESRRRNEQLEMLNRITRVGTANYNPGELLETLAGTVRSAIGGDYCFITLWDPETKVPVPTASSPPLSSDIDLIPFMPGGQSLTSLALARSRPLVIPDVSISLYLSREARRSLVEPFGIQTILVLPLQTVEQDIGALLVGYVQLHTFADDELAWAVQAAELIALAIAKAQAYAGLEERVEQRTAELRAANERLLDLTRVKDEFVSNVSHELRTPIASIKLYHHLLTARPDKQAAYLQRLTRETDRLERIIEDLLYLSRMDQGRMQFQWSPVDVNSLVESYLVDRNPLAEEHGLALTFEPQPGLPPVLGDAMTLGRVVEALLTNALNYTPRGGKVTVGTGLSEGSGRWVTVTVCDSGPGISHDERPHVFERFFRGKAAHESGAPGTGLGLSIAKEIVEKHGGMIDLCDSAACDRGACFIIRLPAAEDVA